MKAPLPHTEAARVTALHEYRILDTLPEPAYDDLTRLASEICRTPIALVTLIDSDRQWFKSRVGLDVADTPRDIAFCAHALFDTELLVVRDTTQDERFADNPFVTAAPHIRFYAGAPLVSHDGQVLGTLCDLDSEPRELTSEQMDALRALARQVMAQLELRRKVADLQTAAAERERTGPPRAWAPDEQDFAASIADMVSLALEAAERRQTEEALRISENRFRGMFQQFPLSIQIFAPDGRTLAVNQAWERLFGMQSEQLRDFNPLTDADLGPVRSMLEGGFAGEVVSIPPHLFVPPSHQEAVELQPHQTNPLWLEVSVYPVHEGERVREVLVVHQDVTARKQAEGQIRIGVHDSGAGIPADKIDQLFVPFARLGAEQSGIESTGLGLALSKRLVEAMEGQLEVKSTPGEGSTFFVELPRGESPMARLVREGVPASRPAELARGKPATVLYVEDNLANLSLVESILAARPEITLLPALQGRLGLDLAREHQPDLVLLDLHLPDIPGEEVLRYLKSDARTRHTPVIISADATPGTVERLPQAGADGYLTKALDVDQFLGTIQTMLNQPAS
jgi:PAS domain S-box-containing protein